MKTLEQITVTGDFPAAPLVYGTLAEASRERDRLEAHARIDADVAEPPGYEVAQVVAL